MHFFPAYHVSTQSETNESRKSSANNGFGPPAKSVRIASGALIIRERPGTGDEETAEQIRENPYQQYFPGFEEYIDEKSSDPSLFVYFRRRFGKKKLSEINEAIAHKASEEKKSEKDQETDDGGDPPNSLTKTNRGRLLADATCTPGDITFPTDLRLLNTAREKSEKIIDIQHRPLRRIRKKPRTYRRVAGKAFLSVAKDRRLSKNKRRKALGSVDISFL